MDNRINYTIQIIRIIIFINLAIKVIIKITFINNNIDYIKNNTIN